MKSATTNTMRMQMQENLPHDVPGTPKPANPTESLSVLLIALAAQHLSQPRGSESDRSEATWGSPPISLCSSWQKKMARPKWFWRHCRLGAGFSQNTTAYTHPTEMWRLRYKGPAVEGEQTNLELTRKTEELRSHLALFHVGPLRIIWYHIINISMKIQHKTKGFVVSQIISDFQYRLDWLSFSDPTRSVFIEFLAAAKLTTFDISTKSHMNLPMIRDDDHGQVSLESHKSHIVIKHCLLWYTVTLNLTVHYASCIMINSRAH